MHRKELRPRLSAIRRESKLSGLAEQNIAIGLTDQEETTCEKPLLSLRTPDEVQKGSRSFGTRPLCRFPNPLFDFYLDLAKLTHISPQLAHRLISIPWMCREVADVNKDVRQFTDHGRLVPAFKIMNIKNESPD
jgi:hypothetical protein